MFRARFYLACSHIIYTLLLNICFCLYTSLCCSKAGFCFFSSLKETTNLKAPPKLKTRETTNKGKTTQDKSPKQTKTPQSFTLLRMTLPKKGFFSPQKNYYLEISEI